MDLETIAAIATPLGEGGVAIVRISGKKALPIIRKIFSNTAKPFTSHQARYGRIHDEDGRFIDDVLLLPMLDGRSYTGEDVIEIQCHGGSLISRKVLEMALRAGARPAAPGEFTFRAFMNGKMDLAQAEAVQELIAAKNEHALAAANQQLQGALSKKIQNFQKNLIDIAAILEAWVDFPEEGIEFTSLEEVCAQLESACLEMQQLLDTFHDGKLLHDGIKLCLVGSPNVGKSSLMNALLDKERAIVSDIAGTTRDTLEDHLILGGFNFRLTDTAGIRQTDDVIEYEGVKRSRQAMNEADLVLWVLDLSRGLDKNDQALLQEIPPQKTLVVWNKSDLPHTAIPPLPVPHVVKISAKTQTGIEDLKKHIDQILWTRGPPSFDEVLITQVRHKEALTQAILHCKKVIQGLKEGVSPEFLASDMRQSLTELGKIIGLDITEDILSAIFSKFCIGK